MSLSTSQGRRRHRALALAIGGLLFLAYLLTFSGAIRSDDEIIIIDTTDSMAVRGSLLLNQTVYLRGLQTTDVEPAQPVLAIPLYWLAYHTPWVGNFHAIFLFNPVITALTAILLFYYALDLGYRERTALVAALLFGLTTIVWPYAQTFFRESLTMFNLLAAAFFLERWRRAFVGGGRRHWLWLALSVGVTLLALLSKEAVLIALPVLLALAFPGLKAIRERRREATGIGIGLAVVVLVFVLGLLFYREQLEAISLRYAVFLRLRGLWEGLPNAWYAALAYLVSPSKGIVWYSPVLILAVGAPFVLPRGRWRESWLLLALVLLFVVSYAAVRGEVWHGGAGWGSRYMVPLTPFLMLAALPLIDRMLNSARRWPKIVLGALGALGLAVQVGGVYVNIYSYYSHQISSTDIAPWRDAMIWSVRWSQAVGSLLFLPQAECSIIWLVKQPDWLVIGAITVGLALIAALLVWLVRNHDSAPPRWVITGALCTPLLVAGLSLFALWRAYDDPRYKGHREDLHAMREYLAGQAQPEDAIMLSAESYVGFFSNYYKGKPIWYTLPLSPGERYSCEQEPEVVSDRVEDLIAPGAQSMFGWVQYNPGALWLVVDSGPYVPCATRPPEWYLAKYMFMVDVVDFSPKTRLVRYLPLPAPTSEARPAHRVDAQLGDVARLVGYDLTINERLTALDDLHPGDMLGVSLLWRAIGDVDVDVDYTSAVYLLNEAGQVVLQQDRYPVDGFAPTSGWEPGDLIRDNFGFILPDDLPPGAYQLWVVMYDWQTVERLPVSGPGGEDWGDHVVLGTIEVR